MLGVDCMVGVVVGFVVCFFYAFDDGVLAMARMLLDGFGMALIPSSERCYDNDEGEHVLGFGIYLVCTYMSEER